MREEKTKERQTIAERIQPEPHGHAGQGLRQRVQVEATDTTLRSGLALPACRLSGIPEGTRDHPEHESQGQLPGQRHDGELLRDNEVGTTLSK